MKRITVEEAIARAALEAGISVAAGYPGSPSTKTMEALSRYAGPDGIHAEWSSNEKAALDVALGASLGGARSMLLTKSVGMNVALDALMCANMTGIDAACVILLGDDPGGWMSQNEQDTRWLALLSELPLLEPPTPEMAPDTVHAAVDLSEQFRLPVFLRITRSLAEAKLDADDAPPTAPPPSQPPPFQREHMKWILMTANAVDRHEQLVAKLDQVRSVFATSPLNASSRGPDVGVIACGFPYTKLTDVLGGRGAEHFAVLRLGTIHPLPDALLLEFLTGLKHVLVLEENEPIVETQVQALVGRNGLGVACHGKTTGEIPHAGELYRGQIATALTGIRKDFAPASDFPPSAEDKETPSSRGFCDGCPHAATLTALRAAIDEATLPEQPIVCGDPGCIVRGTWPPFRMLDIKFAMGCSIGLAKGVAHARPGHPVIALVGDSSFFHTGINNLINIAHNRAPITIVVTHNATTALTGRQTNPGSDTDLMGTSREPVVIEEIVKACGIDRVTTIDPHDTEDAKDRLLEALQSGELSVVVSRAPCQRLAEA